MEELKFLAGNEKRFFDFISEMNDKDKIAIVSHTDLDGLASAKIVNEVVKADIVKLIGYDDLNQVLINYLKKEKIKQVVFSDLSINSDKFLKEAEKHFKILWIDHHLFPQDFNSEKTVYLNSHGFCAAYLCYYLFSKISNLEKLDWLTASASISDWQYFNNQEFMRKTLEKYGDKFEIEDKTIRKSGKFWNLQWDLSLALIYFKDNLDELYDLFPDNPQVPIALKKGIEIIQNKINNTLEIFEKEKTEIKEGYYFEYEDTSSLGSIISNLLGEKYWNKKIIIFSEKDGRIKISCRRQDKKEDLPKFLKSITEGIPDASSGGHFAAAGASIPIKFKKIFIDKLKKL